MLTYRITATGPLFAPNAGQGVEQEIVAELGELGAMGQRLVVERTPAGVSSGGGGLRGTIFTELRGQRDLVVRAEQIVASSAFYAPIVELGRRPGKRPPIAPIRLWVQRKLGVGEQKSLRIAFLVARKIGLVGYSGAFMFKRTADQMRPIAIARFAALGARLAQRLGGR